jgi:hypothetical protein
MSAYYGKMPNHEVPGLFFFLLGVVLWGFCAGTPSTRNVLLAGAAWALAAFSSWHAILCVLGWLAMQWDARRRRAVAVSVVWMVAVTALALLHLLWAGDWALLESQSRSAGYWFAGSDGSSLGARARFLRHALGIGINRFAQLPALLSIGWLLTLGLAGLRHRRPPDRLERNLLGLGLGSMVYYLLFPRAVSFHAYQGFYTIPFVALTSSVALHRLELARFFAERPRLQRALPALALGLTCVIGVVSTVLMYRTPSTRVLEVVRTLESQYR